VRICRRACIARSEQLVRLRVKFARRGVRITARNESSILRVFLPSERFLASLREQPSQLIMDLGRGRPDFFRYLQFANGALVLTGCGERQAEFVADFVTLRSKLGGLLQHLDRGIPVPETLIRQARRVIALKIARLMLGVIPQRSLRIGKLL